MTTRSKDIIFLLGAGASVESKIPMSAQMIKEVEELLKMHEDWKRHLDLYHHVKSGIFFSAGLKGLFNSDVPFNIETLVSALYELERNEEHPLYPFIASWNSRFVALAGDKFCNIRALRRRILGVLKRWMCPADPSLADYYSGLKTVQRDLNYPLRVFSLNYDMCVERLSANDFRVETGFEGHGSRFAWDFQRFEDVEDGAKTPAEIYLYKLHGSINWMRDPATKNLFSHEQIESVDAERLEVIFGRDFKLEAADPYLFYAYEFRKYTLTAKLIVSIGYGFMDSHINKMITQGLRTDPSHRVLVVQNFKEEKDSAEALKGIVQRLELTEDQGRRVLSFVGGGTKTFFRKEDLSAYLNEKLLPTEGAPF